MKNQIYKIIIASILTTSTHSYGSDLFKKDLENKIRSNNFSLFAPVKNKVQETAPVKTENNTNKPVKNVSSVKNPVNKVLPQKQSNIEEISPNVILPLSKLDILDPKKLDREELKKQAREFEKKHDFDKAIELYTELENLALTGFILDKELEEKAREALKLNKELKIENEELAKKIAEEKSEWGYAAACLAVCHWSKEQSGLDLLIAWDPNPFTPVSLNGLALELDYDRKYKTFAKNYFEQAAKNLKSKDAMYRLAELYSKGSESSMKWLKKAAKYGHEEAKKLLEKDNKTSEFLFSSKKTQNILFKPVENRNVEKNYKKNKKETQEYLKELNFQKELSEYEKVLGKEVALRIVNLMNKEMTDTEYSMEKDFKNLKEMVKILEEEANKGNFGAKLILDELKEDGLTVDKLMDEIEQDKNPEKKENKK